MDNKSSNPKLEKKKLISIEYWESVKSLFILVGIISFLGMLVLGLLDKTFMLESILGGLAFILFWTLLAIISWIMLKGKNSIALSENSISCKRNAVITVYELSSLKDIVRKKFKNENSETTGFVVIGFLMKPFYVNCIVSFTDKNPLMFPVSRLRYKRLRRKLLYLKKCVDEIQINSGE